MKAGLLNETTVRERVKPLFYTRMRLGEFDPPSMNPYTRLDLSLIQSPAHRALSLEAAKKSFVLLKNQGGFLPIKKTFGVVSVRVYFSPVALGWMGMLHMPLDIMYVYS